MRESATDTFGNKWWIKGSFWWPMLEIRIVGKYFPWFIRIIGIIIILGCSFILIWVYILGN